MTEAVGVLGDADSESLALKPSSIAAAAVLDGMNGLCSDQCWQDTYALFSCHLDEVPILSPALPSLEACVLLPHMYASGNKRI